MHTNKKKEKKKKSMQITATQRFLLITSITFFVFFVEAFFHFCVGKQSERSNGFNNKEEDTSSFIVVPTWSDLWRIATIVIVFSMINGLLTAWIQSKWDAPRHDFHMKAHENIVDRLEKLEE